MTPKEKAKELVKIYISTCQSWNIDYVNSKTIEDLKKELFQLEWFIPKECALIAVNEVLKSYLKNQFFDTFDEYKYWQLVKQEIEKL